MKEFKPLKELGGVIETKWRYEIHKYSCVKLINFFKRTSISANEITIFGIIFGIISGFLFMTGDYLFILLGVVFFHISSLCDGVDGSLARIKKQSGGKGAFMDELMHLIVTPLVIIGFGVGAYMNSGNTLFIAVAITSFYFFTLNKWVQGEESDTQKVSNKKSRSSLIKKEIGDFFRFTVPFNYLYLFGILNLIEIGSIIYMVFIITLSLKNLKTRMSNFS